MLLQFYSFPQRGRARLRESSACYPSYTKIIESKPNRERGRERERERDDVKIVQSKERVYFVLFYN